MTLLASELVGKKSKSSGMSSRYPCEYPNVIFARCGRTEVLDPMSKVYVRCRKCDGCIEFRKKKFIASALDRIDYANSQKKIKRRKTAFWTFGTNLKDNAVRYADSKQVVYPNRRVISGAFQAMKKLIYVHYKRRFKSKIDFLVWNMETGQGGYLHIHCIISGFLPHKYVRGLWSKYTMVREPNVNFKKVKGSKKSFIAYMAKYMSKTAKKSMRMTTDHKYSEDNFDESKDLIKYHWSGSLIIRGIPALPQIPKMCWICQDHLHDTYELFREDFDIILISCLEVELSGGEIL